MSGLQKLFSFFKRGNEIQKVEDEIEEECGRVLIRIDAVGNPKDFKIVFYDESELSEETIRAIKDVAVEGLTSLETGHPRLEKTLNEVRK